MGLNKSGELEFTPDQELTSGCHFVFIYPQIKKLTGAQRLILALAGAVVALPSRPPNRVSLLTHHFAQECRAALPSGVEIIESGVNLNRTGNHYFDSLMEYGSVPSLLKHLPETTDVLCFFGPPSLPGLWWARTIRKTRFPLLYFCYEPPRAAYTDRDEVSKRMGFTGYLARPIFKVYRPLDKYFVSKADAVLVNGDYGRSLVQEIYGLESTVITHGVELPQPLNFEKTAEDLKTRYGLRDKKILLTVNHLHPRKRIDLFLQSLPLVLKQEPDAAALIVGTGPEEAALKDLASDLGLRESQVIFAGFVPEEELSAVYKMAEIYVHTGKAESFGLAVLEASAAGLPVVAVDEGGPREIIIPDESGFLVPPDPTAIAHKICWLLANPVKAREMGQRGLLRASHTYTWQKGAEAFTGLNMLNMVHC